MNARERHVATALQARPGQGHPQLSVGMATRSGGDEAVLAVEPLAGQLAPGDELLVVYTGDDVRLHAREEAKEPHALRQGLVRVLRSSARFFVEVLRFDPSERVVARLGVSYGLALVGGAFRAHVRRESP